MATELFLYGGPGPVFQGEIVTTLEFGLPIAGQVPHDFNEAQECQQDNRNIRIIVEVLDQDLLPVNIRDTTPRVLRVLRPDGTSEDFAASLLTNGMDGKLYWDTEADDLEEGGLYQVQAILSSGADLQTTRLGKFWVRDNIVEPEEP